MSIFRLALCLITLLFTCLQCARVQLSSTDAMNSAAQLCLAGEYSQSSWYGSLVASCGALQSDADATFTAHPVDTYSIGYCLVEGRWHAFTEAYGRGFGDVFGAQLGGQVQIAQGDSKRFFVAAVGDVHVDLSDTERAASITTSAGMAWHNVSIAGKCQLHHMQQDGEGNYDRADESRNSKFASLDRSYIGKQVKNVLALNKAHRPHIDRDGMAVPIEAAPFNGFSLGVGLDWKLPVYKIGLGIDLGGFFNRKQRAVYTYDSAKNTGQIRSVKVTAFLGTAAKLYARWQIAPRLNVIGQIAAFWPGSYYRGITGAPMSTEPVTRLVGRVDYVEKPSSLNSDTVYCLSVGIQYSL